jgi:hypothetical protein
MYTIDSDELNSRENSKDNINKINEAYVDA